MSILITVSLGRSWSSEGCGFAARPRDTPRGILPRILIGRESPSSRRRWQDRHVSASSIVLAVFLLRGVGSPWFCVNFRCLLSPVFCLPPGLHYLSPSVPNELLSPPWSPPVPHGAPQSPMELLSPPGSPSVWSCPPQSWISPSMRRVITGSRGTGQDLHMGGLGFTQ